MEAEVAVKVVLLPAFVGSMSSVLAAERPADYAERAAQRHDLYILAAVTCLAQRPSAQRSVAN